MGLARHLAYALLVTAVTAVVVLTANVYTWMLLLGERNPFRERPAMAGRIPAVMFKTGPLPPDAPSVRPLLEEMRNRTAGELHVRYLNDEDSRIFVETHCGTRALAAYDTLVPGSYKADIFRYCAIWSHGGIYSDLSQRWQTPLHALVNLTRDELVLVRDRPKPLMHPGVTPVQICLIAATPRHWVMRLALDTAVENVHKRYYGRTPLDITGPFMFGQLLSPGGPAEGAKFRMELEEIGGALVHIGTTQPLIYTKDGGKGAARARLNHAPRYTSLWWSGGVYKAQAAPSPKTHRGRMRERT